MASHYNQISADAIGDNRHNHGKRNKYQAALQTAVSQVSIKSAQRKRRNQVAQATAGFNYGPVPARDGKKTALPVNRDARQLQCLYGKVGGKVYQRRNKRFPKGTASKDKPSGKANAHTIRFPRIAQTAAGIIATRKNCSNT